MGCDHLIHYGIKGQRWGVRRYQNYDGTRIIPQNTTVKRVSIHEDDPIFDNKKYVSINQKDHAKWCEFMGNMYVKKNVMTWEQTYITTKDLKIATEKDQSKIIKDMRKDPEFNERYKKDIKDASNTASLPLTMRPAINTGRAVAFQYQVGKDFVDRLMSEGYDGMLDVHGTNIGTKNPTIIFNPDKNLEREGSEYTKITKKRIEEIEKHNRKIEEMDRKAEERLRKKNK